MPNYTFKPVLPLGTWTSFFFEQDININVFISSYWGALDVILFPSTSVQSDFCYFKYNAYASLGAPQLVISWCRVTVYLPVYCSTWLTYPGNCRVTRRHGRVWFMNIHIFRSCGVYKLAQVWLISTSNVLRFPLQYRVNPVGAPHAQIENDLCLGFLSQFAAPFRKATATANLYHSLCLSCGLVLSRNSAV